VLAVKAAIWIVALSSGTSGGVLAPLLIMGGALGAIEGHFLPFADTGFWALLGMAAILGGTMRAPLTSTLFAVELTGNSQLLLPLLVASVAAFAVTVLIMRRSILTERIARRGHHIWREYSIDPFLQTRVKDIMAQPVHTLAASMPAAEAVALMTAEGPHRTRAIRWSTTASISSVSFRAATSCVGRGRIWTKAQLSPTSPPRMMCCPPLRMIWSAISLTAWLRPTSGAFLYSIDAAARSSAWWRGVICSVCGLALLREESQRARLLRLPLRAVERS
jgi:hypothetical protein